MLNHVIVHTDLPRGGEAGRDLGSRIPAAFDGRPDAVMLFASPRYEHEALLAALDEACRPKALVG